ncbi:hypothetical protein BH23BAC1_BH23BAC1_46850 [soil metagenome]
MGKNKKLRWFIVFISIVIGFIIYDSFSQPGVHELEGNFKEISMYRNENNTGPIIRIYAVTTSDTLWTEMKKYGDLMLHTKYGNTKVYFFSENQPVPDHLYPGDRNFDENYDSYCLAKYEKDIMDQVSFTRYP